MFHKWLFSQEPMPYIKLFTEVFCNTSVQCFTWDNIITTGSFSLSPFSVSCKVLIICWSMKWLEMEWLHVDAGCLADNWVGKRMAGLDHLLLDDKWELREMSRELFIKERMNISHFDPKLNAARWCYIQIKSVLFPDFIVKHQVYYPLGSMWLDIDLTLSRQIDV